MFIAVTRFSVYQPKSPAWIISKQVTNSQTNQTYKDTLFDESRLDFRLGFLVNVTLPILEKASKGQKFLHIIEYSSLLQNKYVQILNKITEKYNFVKLNEYDELGQAKKNTTEIAIEHFNLDSVEADFILASFILDDDDCVSLDFFEKSQKYLNNAFYGFVISHGLGVNGVFDGLGNITNITESYYPKVNIGLLRIGIFRKERKTIVYPKLIGGHMKVDRSVPTVIDSRDVSFWWSKHASQDTSSLDSYEKGYQRLKVAEHIDMSIIFNKFGSDVLENIESIKLGINI